ncbi:S-layer homology domain-containing protein [Abyssisolibacter fermentans]|uniref:S-layer homology domain-containing protein n=1 Tax=Abyssisolibacter fermentans TaxID=1766203 RepID=UPI000835B49F|nr:S-layer homology domain-containing protein [Abyssisolibacter fermentans]
MKRIVSFALALLLIMSASITDTYAMSKYGKGLPPGLAKKGYMPPGIAKKFNDIDGYDWAKKAIEKMAIKGVVKGYGEGIYAPKSSVTKLEAIIMALRVMGYEEQAKINLDKVKRGTKKLKNKDNIQEWAYGYVAVALDKGILEEVDLIELNLKEPAQRHEVAKYIIRALGYEKEAQSYMKEELRFIDAGAVPLGSVGYVYLSDKKGIITGYPDETFRPNRAVTRAEMAVLIARLDDEVDSDIDENEKLAEIVNINGNKLTLRSGNRSKVYTVLDNTPVYTENGKYTSIDKLEIGMKISIQLNENGIIIFIEIKEYDEEIFDEYVGIVEEIDDDEIEIEADNVKMEFDIEDDVKIEFNNKEGRIDDINEGDKVKVRINDDDEVEYIKVYRELDSREYSGNVEEVDSDSIVIKIDRIKMTFDFADDVEVEFKNREGSISDIREGDSVKVRIDKHKRVEYVEVNRNLDTWQYEGKVEEVDDDSVTIKIDRIKMTFDFANDVEVEFKNRQGSISDIKEGDSIKVKINKYQKVEYVKVNRDLYAWQYEGKVEEVDDDSVTIRIDRINMTFDFADNVEVQFKNREGSITDIREGDSVKVKINKYKRIEYIEVNRDLDTLYYEGKVEEVDKDSVTIKIDSIKMTFGFSNKVEVQFKNRKGSITDIREGDSVKVRTNKYKRIEYIEVNRNLDTWQYESKVEKVDDESITIKVENIRMTFSYANKVEVQFKNREGSISDIRVGDVVKIRINKYKRVEYIEVDRNLDTFQYQGKIDSIDEDNITIKVDGIRLTLDLASNVKVKFENQYGCIEDIKVGDQAKFRVNNHGKIEYIELDRELNKSVYEGIVKEIDEDEITLKVNSIIVTFDLEEDVEVEFKNEGGSIEDIKEGDEVKVRIDDDDEVEYIKVYKTLDYDIHEGLFEKIDNEKLSIVTSKEVIEFEVDSDVKVIFNDKKGDLDDLIVGDSVKVVTLEDDDEIRWVEVDRDYNDELISGKLKNIYEDINQIAIKKDNEIKIFDYNNDVKVLINDDEAEISDLEEDDNVNLIIDDSKVEEIRAYR